MIQEQTIKEALLEKYGRNEPIILKNIDSKKDYSMSKEQFRKILSNLYRENEICRAEQGVYYFTYHNRFLTEPSKLSDEKIMYTKFIKSGDLVYGYKTGISFANSIHLTTQVPKTIEITTEKISKNKTEKLSTTYKIYKSRTEVNNNNVKLLQILDLIVDYDNQIEVSDTEVRDVIENYLENVMIPSNMYKKIFSSYPDRLFRRLFDKQLIDIIEKTRCKNDKVLISR